MGGLDLSSVMSIHYRSSPAPTQVCFKPVRTGSVAVLRAFGLLPFLSLKVHVVRLGKLFEHLVVLRENRRVLRGRLLQRAAIFVFRFIVELLQTLLLHVTHVLE